MILTFMFLLYILNTYINMIKYLQKILLDVSINWHYLHEDAWKTYADEIIMGVSKAAISKHMKKMTNLSVWQKWNILQKNKRLNEETENFF